MPNALETEWNTYQKNKPWLLREHKGEYVLIQGHAILGFYPSQELALKFGCGLLIANTPFLVHQLLEEEPRSVDVPRIMILGERARIVEALRKRAKESEGQGTEVWCESLRVIADMIERGHL
jgi:hypothetical protein